MTTLYYTSPTNEIFNEVKQAAIEVWQTYDDTYGYASGKIGRITEIDNIKDNLMYIVAMFDDQNQMKLALKLSNEARKAVRERMLDGRNTELGIVF